MVGIKTLTIGYTRDIELAEKVARATGANDLRIETMPEGQTLLLDAEEQAEWRKRDWELVGRTAKKKLRADAVEDRTEAEKKSRIQRGHRNEGYSEGGRLKASMLVKSLEPKM